LRPPQLLRHLRVSGVYLGYCRSHWCCVDSHPEPHDSQAEINDRWGCRDRLVAASGVSVSVWKAPGCVGWRPVGQPHSVAALAVLDPVKYLFYETQPAQRAAVLQVRNADNRSLQELTSSLPCRIAHTAVTVGRFAAYAVQTHGLQSVSHIVSFKTHGSL